MPNSLTRRQAEILEYITFHIQARGYAPTYREMMHHFGFSSPGSLYKHVQALQEKNLLKKRSAWRGLSPKKKKPKIEKNFITHIDLIGTIAKKSRIELFKTPHQFAIPSSMVLEASSLYGFIVKDHSFSEEKIASQDIVIIEARTQVREGEAVLVQTSAGESLIYRFRKDSKKGYLELFSYEKEEPVLLKNYTIQGVLVALFRSYAGIL